MVPRLLRILPVDRCTVIHDPAVSVGHEVSTKSDAMFQKEDRLASEQVINALIAHFPLRLRGSAEVISINPGILGSRVV